MNEPHPLTNEDFSHVVRYAPLVSIDIVIKDPENHVLVGLRANEPARGCYFVPGGVVRKNETIEHAFARILQAETGCRATLGNARFLGVFEHFYETNRFGTPGYGTHYIVLAYEIRLDDRPRVALDSQHREFRWMSKDDIRSAAEVHPNTKAYFTRS